MLNNRTSFILLFFLTIVVACGKQSAEPDHSQPVTPEKKPIIISTTLSRVTDSEYEGGDAIGLYVVNRNGTQSVPLAQNGNHANNSRFTYNGTSWASDTPLYWKDDVTHADFYCYYPYQSQIVDIKAVPVSVRDDQRGNGYKESEWLWGSAMDMAPTSNPVNIITKRVLSNLIIKIKPGKGYTDASLLEDLTDVTIQSVRTRGTMDLSTGQVSPAGDISVIRPANTSGADYRAMIIPQSIDNAKLISVVVGGNTYYLEQTITFLPNKQHTCTVTVNRTSEGINVGIGAWEEDSTDYGGVIN